MTRLFKHRVLAWIIDYGIIVLYAVLLFMVTRIVFDIKQAKLNPYFGQLIGFLVLTLPVVVYSYLTEKSKLKATIGKRILKLVVLTPENKTTQSILLRNVLKYLPWELAHTGVHWIIYFDSIGSKIPIWTWVVLVLPQIMMFIYFISIIFSKGKESIYDKVSRTSLKLNISD